MATTYEAGSPDYWRDRLLRRLVARRPQLERFDAYYNGEHDLAFAGPKFRENFGHLFRAFADNFCMLVVDAERERMNIDGFRVGDAPEADEEAWRIWQDNDLDARSAIAHTEALVKGIAYAGVWAGDDGRPVITIEDPVQVIVEQDFGGRGPRLAALKLWLDDSGTLYHTLYLPDFIYKYQSRQPLRSSSGFNLDRWASPAAWERRAGLPEEQPWPMPNALGVVPMVPLVNNPRLSGDGRSEVKAVVPLQDAINKTVADMLVSSEFSAFRQRWVTGIDIPIDPTTGLPVEPFKSAIDRLWVANAAEGGQEPKFGEFGQTDLTGYVATVEMLVQHVASITKTPAHYLLGQSGNFPSGEALKATETGLVAKTKLAMRYFGEAWEEVMSLAFKVMSDERADSVSETIWRDPESHGQAELTDAVMKEQALGVPQEALWQKLGYTPMEIARFKVMQAEQSLLTPTGSVAPTPAPAQPTTPLQPPTRF